MGNDERGRTKFLKRVMAALAPVTCSPTII